MCLLYVYVIWQCSNNYPFCALTYTRTCLVQCPEWQSHWSVMRGDVLPYRLGHMNFWTYKVYLNEINSSYEKSYRGLRIHLPLINVICTKVGGAIPLPYAYFVNKTSINYPSVHHLVLSRLHQMSPPPLDLPLLQIFDYLFYLFPLEKIQYLFIVYIMFIRISTKSPFFSSR